MYSGYDFYKLSDDFSEEERLLQESVRKFVDRSFMPLIKSAHSRGEFPLQLVREMGELGILGITIPEEYGAAGLTHYMYGLAMQELERGDSGLRSFASVQGSLVMFPIYSYGSEEQKRRWLPQLASGEKVGCFGLTEPNHGSDPGSMITHADKIDGGWLLNGAKMWITNGDIADIAVVWARTKEGIRGFLVEKEFDGYRANRIKGKYSLRASITSELSFDDCFVPDENILPYAEGLKAPLSCLNEARYGIAWGAVGAASACYDEALEYAKARIQFGKPIASFQLTQEKLVEMLNEITKAQLLVHRLGRLKDAGKAKHYHISLAKRNNVREALKIARSARSILGAAGITDEYQTIRHLMNLESVVTYEGTEEIHTLILGNQITELNAFN